MTSFDEHVEKALRPPGWYRVTNGKWTLIASAGTPSRDLPDDPFELVLVEDSTEEVPLW